MLFLEDGEFAVLSRDGVQLVDVDGAPARARAASTIQWDPVSAEKGGYDHFMQKEIFEQPRAIATRSARACIEADADIDLDGIDFSAARGAAHRAREPGRLRHGLLRLPGRQVL